MYALRAMTEAERETLQERMANIKSMSSSSLTSLGLGFILGCVTFLGAGFFLVRFVKPLGWLKPQILFAISIFLGVFVFALIMARSVRDSKRMKAIHHSELASYQLELGEELVEECEVKTKEVIAVDDPWDGNDSLVFKMTEHSAMLVRGGEYKPTDDFRIVRLPKSKLVLRLDMRGCPIPITSTVPASVDMGRLQTGDLIAADWKDICLGQFVI